jgi:hypothetical protein
MADKNYDYAPSGDAEQKPGPFLARVVSHLDPTYMGVLEVEILRPAGGDGVESQLHQVKYMSPFYGITGVKHVQADPDNYNNTQKSYGMWMIPPDPGTTVIVFFIDGDPRQGYWMGCVQDENANFMIPGIAATQNNVEGTYTRAPVAEYNKQVNDTPTDPTTIKKPTHPLADVLNSQGLIKDDIRGITTSSARREAPSMVFGISTPGPLDKRPGAKQGPVGKIEHLIPNAPVSRLGGTTFVMDDGDDKWLRKTKAKDGPPEYASVEQGDYSGKPDIPHNELVRIRTRTGHQLLMHNSEDLIYITNSRGTAWIEFTSDGKIDIYAQDSISMHTANDINFIADRDINFNATGNINMTSGISMYATTKKTFEVSAGTDVKLTAKGNSHISSAHHFETAGKIDMNGPAAEKATAAKLPVRVPQTEPWEGHENLDPTSFKPDKTKATETGPVKSTPAAFGMYTTSTDTFNKVQGGS